jgi:23S rRNA (guanosine2251-2'-O)-methyltransferase
VSSHIEGRNPVAEALRAGVPVSRVLIARGAKPDPVLDEIRSLAGAADAEVREVERHELDKMSSRGAHQGVVATALDFAYTPIESVLTRIADAASALIVVLDHVTDPGNLGAIIRSTEVAGGSAVVIPAQRAASVGPVVHKASAGATAYLPVVQVPNIARTLETLKGAGFWALGADGAAELDLWSAPLDGRIALVLGSEGSGLSRLVRESCDVLVSIPVKGRVDSLNVAQAVSVLAYEWARRLGST